MIKCDTSGGLNYYQFESFLFNHCRHGIFTRHGGVSPAPWSSLNQGGTVGDSRENVVENRKKIFECIERPVSSIFDVWQVHGTNIVCAELPRRADEPHQKADAIFTNNPDISLFMRFADCVPILIYDPVKHVIGIIHAGWKGTVNNIIKKAVQTIQDKYSSNPNNIFAGIGPSIGPDHYEIGPEVGKKVKETFCRNSDEVLLKINGSYHFDLWKAIEYQLHEQGINRIESANMCTACNIAEWYSHRAEHGNTGRFGVIITLKGNND
jgi:YfiH family protein